MTDHREFVVPKEKQKVTVHLAGGETRNGNIFLEYHPEAPALYEKITAFLEEKNEFFPLAADGGGLQFINKRSVRMMEVEYPAEESTFSLMHIEKISAVFSDGSHLDGLLMADVPSEKDRLSDCLNLSNRFLSVRVNDRVHFINKDAVRKVTPASTT